MLSQEKKKKARDKLKEDKFLIWNIWCEQPLDVGEQLIYFPR